MERASDRFDVRWANRVSIALLVFALTVLLATWAFIGLRLHADEDSERHHAAHANLDVARILAEHSALALNSAARLADEVKQQVESGQYADVISRKVHVKQWGEHIVQLALADADGQITYSNLGPSTANIRDRPHFLVHVGEKSDRIFVSAPVLGRVSKRWTVQVSRRLSTKDGEFAGVVVVSVDPFYYTRLYSALEVGRSGLISNIGHDGIIRSQTVDGKEAGMGTSLPPNGLLERMRVVDADVMTSGNLYGDKVWLCGFKRIPGYAMSIVVAQQAEHVLFKSKQSRSRYYIFGIVTTIVVLSGSAAVLLSLRRQSRLTTNLRLAFNDATVAMQAKDRFIRLVSHEMRTPLTGIVGFSELLLASPALGEEREYASQIHRSAEDLSQILHRILDVQLAEDGGISMQLSDERVLGLLEMVVLRSQDSARAKGLALRLEFDWDCAELLIRADVHRLKQVVTTLLNNGIKYTEEGEIVVRLSCNKEFAIIDISDTGPGITPESAISLFERFTPAVLERRPEGGGLGLGLALARYLIDLMGGTLKLMENTSSGAVFRLQLPLSAH